MVRRARRSRFFQAAEERSKRSLIPGERDSQDRVDGTPIYISPVSNSVGRTLDAIRGVRPAGDRAGNRRISERSETRSSHLATADDPGSAIHRRSRGTRSVISAMSAPNSWRNWRMTTVLLKIDGAELAAQSEEIKHLKPTSDSGAVRTQSVGQPATSVSAENARRDAELAAAQANLQQLEAKVDALSQERENAAKRCLSPGSQGRGTNRHCARAASRQ